jgi:superfamily II DNA or RNA helicase
MDSPVITLRDASVMYPLSLHPETKAVKRSDVISPEADFRGRGTLCIYYEILSFKDQVLTLKSEHNVSAHKRQFYTQQVVIDDDHIGVSCNCGFEAIDLCVHAREVLVRIFDEHGLDYFKQFTCSPWNDQARLETYFNLNHSYKGIKVQPKAEYGKIYGYYDERSSQLLLPELLQVSALTERPAVDLIGYTMSFLGRNRCRIPFLVPFSASLSKDKTDLRSYIEFLEPGTQQIGLTPDQRIIHSYCNDFKQMLSLKDNHPAEDYRPALTEEEKQNCQIAFNYWKELMPLLKKQGHLAFYWFMGKAEYGLKPKRSSMQPIRFSDERIRFKLVLTEHPEYFSLSCNAFLNGEKREIEAVFSAWTPFFITLKPDKRMHYLFSSLKEAEIIRDFDNSKFRVTIFKNDFAAFNQSVLNVLSADFPVEYHFKEKGETIKLTVLALEVAVEEREGYIYFKPYIVYDHGVTVNVFTGGVHSLELTDDVFQVLERNKETEECFKKLFTGLHPSFITQDNEGVFYLPQSDLLLNGWLAAAIYQLSTISASMIGLEKLEGLNEVFTPPVISVKVNAEKDWFDISVNVKLGDVVLSNEEIRKALKSKASGFQLSNGKTAYFPDSFFKQLDAVYRNGEMTEHGIRIAGQHYTLIDHLYNKQEQPDLAGLLAERAKLFEELEQMPLTDVPVNVNAVLRPYQKIGFSWMYHLFLHQWGGLLADDMGLGKTLQVLTLLQHLKNEFLADAPHLLIAPTSLLFNWKEEAEKFCPDLKVMIYHGTDREKDQKELLKYDLIITSYGTVLKDIDFLKAISFQYLILDEAQAIKNPLSQRFKMATLIQAQQRLALTGTPVENSTSDLYALMSFVNPGFFGTLKSFNTNLVSKRDELDTGKVASLLRMTNPFILRRTKAQVATDLPPKTEMVIWCEMEPAQRKIYDTCRRRYKEELIKKIDEEGLEHSQLYVLDGLLKLRQICNSPSLVKNADPFTGNCCKIDELMIHITEKTVGHKVLVFSQFIGMLDLIRKQLEAKDISYAYLDGKTKLDKRREAVANFQQQEDTRVFLISLKAGGTGLNLTAADYVYLVDPWWNPAAESQAIDRCYRIGQDKHVMAYRMICKDTLEEKILDMQQKKKKLAGELIPTDEGILKSMSKEDILKLFG